MDGLRDRRSTPPRTTHRIVVEVDAEPLEKLQMHMPPMVQKLKPRRVNKRRAIASALALAIFVVLVLAYANRESIEAWVERVQYRAVLTKGAAQRPYPVPGSPAMLFEVPPVDDVAELRGLVVVAHDCDKPAAAFWPKTAHCPQCRALPEEARLVKGLLHKKFVVLGVSSQDKCWSPDDIEPVTQAVHALRDNLLLPDIPLFVFGYAAGGEFASLLAMDASLKWRVVVVEEAVLKERVVDKVSIPVMFVVMKQNEELRKKAKVQVQKLFARGVPVEMWDQKQLAITDDFFSSRVPGLPEGVSSKLRSSLQSLSLVDDDGKLVSDPRTDKTWRDALKQVLARDGSWKDGLNPHSSPISAEMNVAWAYHALSADAAPHMATMFERWRVADPVKAAAAPPKRKPQRMRIIMPGKGPQ